MKLQARRPRYTRSMTETNSESDEIDLHPVEDEITQFSDNDQVILEHTNFEFEQSHRLRGVHRQLTVFNDNQCYQKIKNKHRRKYKFRLDLAFLDPRPFRIRNIAWKWLYASLALWGLDAVMIFAGWFDTSSIELMGLFIAFTLGATITLLAFFYLSYDIVYFRSQYGKIRLLELENKRPNPQSFTAFINKIVVQINKSKTARGLDQSKFLAAELKELRRLKDESIVPEESYEKAKRLIFKHEAFKSSE
jgi:hypothetical protein